MANIINKTDFLLKYYNICSNPEKLSDLDWAVNLEYLKQVKREEGLPNKNNKQLPL